MSDALVFVVSAIGTWGALVWLSWLPVMCCRHLVGMGTSQDSVYLMLLVSQMISMLFLIMLQLEWVAFNASVSDAVIIWLGITLTLMMACMMRCFFHRMMLIILTTFAGLTGSFWVYAEGGPEASIAVFLATIVMLLFIGFRAWNAYVLTVVVSVCSSAVITLATSIVFFDDRDTGSTVDAWLLTLITIGLAVFRSVIMLGLCCSYHFMMQPTETTDISVAGTLTTPLIHSKNSKQLLPKDKEDRGLFGWRYNLPASEVELV